LIAANRKARLSQPGFFVCIVACAITTVAPRRKQFRGETVAVLSREYGSASVKRWFRRKRGEGVTAVNRRPIGHCIVFVKSAGID